ncbi:MAG TPA: hypothetical protein VMD59_22425, partial [Acidimicrobiales bacterium]|nr:hypothetical protein [Acidimicrobiales bacterium]
MTSEQRLVAEIDGRELSLSNLDKVLYPETGFTKAELIAYYVGVGGVLAAHLAGRPATFKRFPDGVDRPSFFEKHLPRHAPPWVRRVRVPRLGRVGSQGADGQGTTIDYVVLEDVASLAWAANLGTIELHVPMWRADYGLATRQGAHASTAARRRGEPVPVVEIVDEVRPDTVVLDLDPGPPAGILECCAVALELRPRLESLGLHGVAKTSGRKGLQVYAALRPPRPWREVHALAHELARAVERDSGGLVLSNMRRDLRRGRVLVDW